MSDSSGRTNAVLSKLTVIGDLLMLQLVFLVLGLGIITLYPGGVRAPAGAAGRDQPGAPR